MRQVVSRFLFLRDQQDLFLRTFLQIRVASALPNFIVTSNDEFRYGVSTFLREAVAAFRCLSARFTLEYLSNVTRKRLSRDFIETVLPVLLYRSMYSGRQGEDVLKRVKKTIVPAGVKTFFYKLHTNTLPVKMWLEQRGDFLPWGSDC